MNQKRLKRHDLLVLSLYTIVPLCLFAACGEQGPGEQGDITEVVAQSQDTNMIECPEGQIPWIFSAQSIGQGESTIVSYLADDDVKVEHPWAIEPQTAKCGSDVVSGTDGDGDGLTDRNWTGDWTSLRGACAGQASCSFSPSVCGSNFSFDYTCSSADRESSGTQRVYTASVDSSGKVVAECTPPARETVEIAATDTAQCIVAECPGRTYRDVRTMACLPDALKDEVGLLEVGWKRFGENRALEIGEIQPAYPVQSEHNDVILDVIQSKQKTVANKTPEYIYPGTPYKFPIYLAVDGRLPLPLKSTVSAWIADTFYTVDPDTLTATPMAPIYRCLAFAQDIEARDFQKDIISSESYPAYYASTLERTLSDECLSGNTSETVALAQVPEGHTLHYSHSQFMLTYDIEGRTAMHKNLALSYKGQEEGVDKYVIDTNPECAPNPVDFYYDPAKKIYDMRGYYFQRPTAIYATPFKFEKTGRFDNSFGPRQAEIAPIDFKARKDEFIFSAQSPTPQSIPVEVTWMARNFHRNHLFQPFHDIDTEGMGAGWFSGNPSDGLELPNLRADIYLMKSNAGINGKWDEALLIGSLPLGADGVNSEGNVPDGKIDTGKVFVPKRVVRAFMDASGNHYIGPDDPPARYDIGYCINTDIKYGQSGEDFFTDRPVDFRADPESGQDAIVRLDQHDPLWQNIQVIGGSRPRTWGTYVEEGMTDSVVLTSSRRVNGHLRKHCTWQPTPVLVDIDYFETPVLPAAAQGFGGSQDRVASGGNALSAANGNDSQVTCDDVSKQDCDEVMVANNRGGGADSRTYFDITSESDRTEGSEVSAGARGEMLGFQVLDPDDPEESTLQKPTKDSLNWPGKDARVSTPVSITIAPDWDGLRAKFQKAASGTSVEWATGRYGGIMGLGVGWGIKKIWIPPVSPVPITVIFTVTVGASVELKASFQFAPTKDEEYPCLNSSEACFQLVTDEQSYEDASDHCNGKGGRLAEAGTQREADAIAETIGDFDDEVWIGGQLAYYHPDQQCKSQYDATLCSGNRTHYRWSSNNETFHASSQSEINGDLFEFDFSSLTTRYPADAAIYIETSTGKLKSDSTEVSKAFVCRYEPADTEKFFKWGLAVGLGLAAGFGLQGCVPTDNPGVCLGASLNVVALTIAPALSTAYHWLYKEGASDSFQRIGVTSFEVPLTISLFEGSIDAVANFLWVTFGWNIASFDGIKLLDQMLYEFSQPVEEVFP